MKKIMLCFVTLALLGACQQQSETASNIPDEKSAVQQAAKTAEDVTQSAGGGGIAS